MLRVTASAAGARAAGPSRCSVCASRMLHQRGSTAPSTSALPLLVKSSLQRRERSLTLMRQRHNSTTTPLHPTPTTAAPMADPSSSSGPSNPYSYELFGAAERRRSRTQLPTPLPHELAARRTDAFKKHLLAYKNKNKRNPVKPLASSPLAFGDLSSATLQSLNENDSFFTPTQTIENLAILRACLATGLTQRALKIFSGMREEVSLRIRGTMSEVSGSSSHNSLIMGHASLLDVKIYNAMLGTMFHKAWQEEDSEERRLWLVRAWQLFRDMDRGQGQSNDALVDPLPDDGTYAVMARGILRFKRSNRYPPKMDDLFTLLNSLRRSDIHLHDVFTSTVFTHEHGEMEFIGGMNVNREGEPDIKSVLHAISPVVAEIGDMVLASELDEVSRMFRGLDEQALKEVIGSGSNPESVEQNAGGMPQLRPVKTFQKDSDVKEEEDEMNFNLRVLRENLSIVQEAKQSSADPYERQHWLESGALAAAQKRFEAGLSHLESIGLANTGSLQKRELQRWMWGWYKKLDSSLEKAIGKMSTAEMKAKTNGADQRISAGLESQILPFVRLLKPAKLAMITILELMRMQASSGASSAMKTASVLVNIGKAVEREYYSEVLHKNSDWLGKQRTVQNTLRQGGIANLQLRREALKAMADDPVHQNEQLEWTTTIRARLGSFLVQHLLDVATVRRSASDRDGQRWDEEQPAFYSAYQYIQGKRLGVIRLNDVVAEKIAGDSTIDTLHPRHLPMLVPPKPWLKYDSGGYLSVKGKALRFKDDFEQASYMRAASEDGSLEYVLSGLDVLGSTAWTINKDIFNVMLEVWNSGKDMANVPPVELTGEEPQKPDNYDIDLKARARYLAKLKHHNLQRLANYSRRCEVNYRLEIARAYQDERFYFPHNMDFRGRAYPMPPLLNHIGNDVSRGLLLFDTAKPLGKVGLRWLRIHLANVYGFDKASFAEREQFTIDHEEDIRKSVMDPLGEGDWWLKADDPWQCLATCMELIKAYEHPEGSEKYESRLPVHQDGTCNGLQHYAALGGDMNGAEQVNLTGKDRPADVYTAVSDLVVEVVNRDAAAGNESAKLLQGKIGRKVVKQTVMTTVYGVTFIGAKAQVARQLLDRGLAHEHVWECSSYLAKQIMLCIGDLFSGAEAIQNWLSESALLIAKSIPGERLEDVTKSLTSRNLLKNAQQIAKEQMTSVIWTTPLGLPVVQPYRKVVRKQVATTMQSVYIHDPHLATQVSPSKQASAFPPNFIHSLDATHMFLTALECQSAGLTFASVHDSYWTHACDIETMSDIIRDTFVRLHSCDILNKLKEEFLERYKGYTVPVLVAKKALAKRAKRSSDKRSQSQEITPSVLVEETESGDLLTERSRSSFAAGTASTSAVPAQEEDLEVDRDTPASNDTFGAEDTDAMTEVLETNKSNQDEVSASFKPDPLARDQRFIPLKDILPDIPKRGSFDVNEIKRSLYFFS